VPLLFFEFVKLVCSAAGRRKWIVTSINVAAYPPEVFEHRDAEVLDTAGRLTSSVRSRPAAMVQPRSNVGVWHRSTENGFPPSRRITASAVNALCNPLRNLIWKPHGEVGQEDGGNGGAEEACPITRNADARITSVIGHVPPGPV